MNIWVPKIKILENTREALVVPGGGVAGFFEITGQLPDGRRRVLAQRQKNLITDGGLNRWGTGAVLTNCSLGSGTTPPTVLDTNLVSFVAQQNSVTTTTGAETSSPYYGWSRKSYVFNPPGADKNISEIGVGWGTGGVNLWSRSLIKDVAGDPTTITWRADETLTVTYEARMYPWEDDNPHSTVISGVTYDGIIRPAYLGGAAQNYFYDSAHLATGKGPYASTLYSGTIGAATGIPSGTTASPTRTNSAYSSGSLVANGVLTAGPTIANFAGGIGAFWVACTTAMWQCSLVPTLAKLNTHTLTLNVNSGVWGRQP